MAKRIVSRSVFWNREPGKERIVDDVIDPILYRYLRPCFFIEKSANVANSLHIRRRDRVAPTVPLKINEQRFPGLLTIKRQRTLETKFHYFPMTAWILAF